MTPPPGSTPPDPLRPVREALLASASADAERLLAQVEEEADTLTTRARAEADTIRAQARAQGETDATALLVTERARARRQARAVVLAAQRDSYDELRSRVLEALPALRGDQAYRAWEGRLREHVLAALGPDASVTEQPDGGVLGEVEGRRASFTLAGLAEQVLDALGPDVEGLWAR